MQLRNLGGTVIFYCKTGISACLELDNMCLLTRVWGMTVVSVVLLSSAAGPFQSFKSLQSQRQCPDSDRRGTPCSSCGVLHSLNPLRPHTHTHTHTEAQHSCITAIFVG